MNQNSMKVMQYRIQPYDNMWMLSYKFNTDINAIESVNPGADLSRLKVGQVINICPESVQCQVNNLNLNNSDQSINKSQLNFFNQIRMLWDDIAIWTRIAIKSAVFNLPDMDYIVNRLFRIPQDFNTVLKPFYGDENADKLSNLLSNYIINTFEIILATNAGDESTAMNAEKKLNANTDELSAFLASINPNWSADEWKKMFSEQLNLTKSEITNLINKNYDDSINDFDKKRINALNMADIMANGIIKQFPDKFK